MIDFNIGDKVCLDRSGKDHGVVDMVADRYVRIMPLNFSTDCYWYSKCGVFLCR